MKGKSKWSLFLALVFVMSVFLSACSGGGGGGQSSTENNGEGGGDTNTSSEDTGKDKSGSGDSGTETFNIAVASEIPSMDTAKGNDEVSFNQFSAVFEGLYTMNSKGEIVPAEAKGEPKVEKKGDEYVYTIKLRDDAVWSNGEPVTAEDYVFAWRKLLKPETAATYAYLMPTLGVKNAAKITNKESDIYGKVKKLGVKAVDEKTLQFTLVKKAPENILYSLLQFPSFFPQPKDFVKKQGDQYALEPENLLYNGPYVMTEWNHNEGWTYEKNPKYWDKEQVDIEQIKYKVVKEQSTRVNLYNVGKLDIVGLDSQYVLKYKDSPEYHTALGTAVYYFMFNEKREILANPKARKALDMAWPKKKFTDVLMKTGAIPANFLVPKNFVKGPEGKDFRAKNGAFTKYNPEKAKKLWKQALEEVGKDSVKLTLLAYPGKSVKDKMVFVTSQWEKTLPGLKVTLNQQPFKVMLKKEQNQQYDIAYAGWGPDYQDPMTFMDLFVTDGGNNNTGFSNEKYDSLIAWAKSHPDQPKKRWAKLQQAEKILLEEKQAIGPMYQKGKSFLLNETVKNFVDHPFGPDYTWKYWEIEK